MNPNDISSVCVFGKVQHEGVNMTKYNQTKMIPTLFYSAHFECVMGLRCSQNEEGTNIKQTNKNKYFLLYI